MGGRRNQSIRASRIANYGKGWKHYAYGAKASRHVNKSRHEPVHHAGSLARGVSVVKRDQAVWDDACPRAGVLVRPSDT